MTLLVRDEADVLDAQIAFHLNAGVDFVVATDNGSVDATTEILERYAARGYAHVIPEPSTDYRQSEWVTRMARLAASEHGADWVINSDADEFWWPRGGSLKEVLAAVPARYGIVRGVWRNFVPQPDAGEFFAELMTLRLSPTVALNDPRSPFRPNVKSAHRGDPQIRVRTGNHELADTSLVPLRSWYPIEVLHFPLRTSDQVVRKYEAVHDAWGAGSGVEHINRTMAAAEAGDVDRMVGVFGAEPEAVRRGLEEGVLVRDTRLRDALRALAGVSEIPGRDDGRPTFALPPDGVALEFPRPTVVDDALFAAEAGVVSDANDVRGLRHLDELEARVAALERTPGHRLTRFARRVVRRG